MTQSITAGCPRLAYSYLLPLNLSRPRRPPAPAAVDRDNELRRCFASDVPPAATHHLLVSQVRVEKLVEEEQIIVCQTHPVGSRGATNFVDTREGAVAPFQPGPYLDPYDVDGKRSSGLRAYYPFDAHYNDGAGNTPYLQET